MSIWSLTYQQSLSQWQTFLTEFLPTRTVSPYVAYRWGRRHYVSGCPSVCACVCVPGKRRPSTGLPSSFTLVITLYSWMRMYCKSDILWNWRSRNAVRRKCTLYVERDGAFAPSVSLAGTRSVDALLIRPTSVGKKLSGLSGTVVQNQPSFGASFRRTSYTAIVLLESETA